MLTRDGDSSLVGGQLGSYRILSRLGAGGMGEVYRAHDPKLRRDIALKVLPREIARDPERRSRLLREARAAASLNHPNICTIYDVGDIDGLTYIAMELVEGRSLSAHLAARPAPPQDVLRYGLQLADALAHAHDHGVVHRDFKSANVMITPGGHVKVVDFGLATRVPGQELTDAATVAPALLTEPGTILGTVPYMAPEQLRGQRADARSDVWALGIVLHEMAMGRRPFDGRTAFEVSSAIFHEAPPQLPVHLPAQLQSVATRCLEKEPGRRYQNGGEVRAALEMVQPVATTSLSGASERRMPRPWLKWALGALLIVAVVALGFIVDRMLNRFTGKSGTEAAVLRVAVLPFDNITRDPAQEYFSDGLTEEMIAQLSRVSPQRLGVIARTSAGRYKKTDKTIEQIGRELGVDYVLTGSARSDAGRVRVTAALVQVRDQTQLWSESYDRELAGILDLQDDVARKIAGSLALTLLPAAGTRAAAARTVNPEAYDAYLRGTAQLTLAHTDGALRYFELALQKDPKSALAYAGIARVWILRLRGYALVSPSEAAATAKAAALKAIELDDARAEAHTVLGTVRSFEFDWAGAEAAFRRALEIDANYALAHAEYASSLFAQKRPQEARAQMDQALKLDPFNPDNGLGYAIELLGERRLDEAIRALRSNLEMSPDYWPAHYWLWIILHLEGKDAEAFVEAKKNWALLPLETQALTRGYAAGGYSGAMRQLAAQIEATGAPKGFWDSGSLADIYVHLGDRNKALEWLEKGFDAGDTYCRLALSLPNFDSVRSDPRFERLVKRMNLPN